MRRILLGTGCFLGVMLCAYLTAQPEDTKSRVRLRLVDASSGKDMAGIVRVFAKDSERPAPLPGLFPRLRGLKVSDAVAGWYVVPSGGAETTLPRAQVQLEALAGLETAVARIDRDLSKDPPKEIVLRLDSILRPEDHGLVAGNTHLHLMKLSAKDADTYLRQIPPADALRVLFISYLERHKDDAEYITNRYPIGDLPDLSATGVLFNNGEEHRHNFGGYGEGYGHVMFLNLKTLVKPVSLGPGITGGGFDDHPLRTGIDDARKQGSTVFWCHNGFGVEDVLNVLTGRLDALNVFDGSRRGSFEDPYYRYLNIGLRLPISTGTDWFLYDFARVYAKVEGKLTVPKWLEAVKAARCQATNGPLLSLTVDGRQIGETLELAKPQKVRIEAGAVGRHDFQELQLVHNGKVIARKRPESKDPFKTQLVQEMRIDEPGWFAARIQSTAKNELDQQLFAHTSPVYIRCQGRDILDVDAARALLKQVEEGQAAIRAQARFSSPQAAARLLSLYDDAVRELQERIKQRGP
jgi:hypothetical protein